MIERRRGAVHIMEAFLASIIIFTTLFYSTTVPQLRRTGRRLTLEAHGRESLLRLDREGLLSRLVVEQDWMKLEECLRTLLTAAVSFNLTVIDEGGAIVNDWKISGGGLIGREIISLDYLLVVPGGRCSFYRLRLQLGG